MTEQEFFWMVGILEGEGSFMAGSPSHPTQCSVVCSMTDEDVIAKLASLLDSTYKVRKRENWKDQYRIWIGNGRAVELMTQLKPYMSKRRQEQISKAINSYYQNLTRKSGRPVNTDEKVLVYEKILV